MAESIASRLADTVWPPTYGAITCLAANTVVAVVDMTTMSGHPANQTQGTEQGPSFGNDNNPLGHYVTLEADGGDIYFAFCATVAQANSLSYSAVSTLNGNTLSTSFTATGMWKLPNGDKQPYLLPPGQNAGATPNGGSSKCRYLGFVTATGAATFRICQSSQ